MKAGGVQRGQILRKLPQFSARNLQKLRKPAEALRKLPHASACFRMLPQENKQKVRKIIEFFSAEAIFTLRKPCGSLAEALRKPCGRLRKAFSKIGFTAEASASSYI